MRNEKKYMGFCTQEHTPKIRNYPDVTRHADPSHLSRLNTRKLVHFCWKLLLLPLSDDAKMMCSPSFVEIINNAEVIEGFGFNIFVCMCVAVQTWSFFGRGCEECAASWGKRSFFVVESSEWNVYRKNRGIFFLFRNILVETLFKNQGVT